MSLLHTHTHTHTLTAAAGRCYCCGSYSAGYIHHLLMTKEMLGHSLLQIHNVAVFSAFIQSLKHQ